LKEMRLGRFAGGVVALALTAASCTGGPGEGLTEPVSTTEPVTDTSTQTETEARPELPRIDAGPPGSGGPLDLREVATGFDSPVFATAAPGEPDRLYVVEQGGRIRILERNDDELTLLDEVFLDISDRVSRGNEQGLLSAVFHPDHVSNGLFYVNYTDLAGDTHVLELRDFGAESEPVEVRELLDVPQPYSNHNGGQLAFGPDGLLYVGMGDGGSSGDPENRAQDLSSRLGKMLRIDVDQPGAEWEKFAYGLRNPWRFSFDRVTGDLWIGDVGQQKQEEIDRVSAPDLSKEFNFGWDVYEGSDMHEDKPLTPGGILVEPLTEYSHDLGCSVTGGYVYRGETVREQAWGRYFYGDYCSGRIWSLARSDGEVTRRGHPFQVRNLTSFAEDLAGELYALSRDGVIYQVVRAM
jgi:glucose/arabinose dehydrogenase